MGSKKLGADVDCIKVFNAIEDQFKCNEPELGLVKSSHIYTGAKSHVHGSSRMYCGPPLAQMYLSMLDKRRLRYICASGGPQYINELLWTCLLAPVVTNMYVSAFSECLNASSLFFFIFLHLHEIVEGLYFHCSLSVCVSVCPALLVNKIPAERMHRFGRGFR